MQSYIRKTYKPPMIAFVLILLSGSPAFSESQETLINKFTNSSLNFSDPSLNVLERVDAADKMVRLYPNNKTEQALYNVLSTPFMFDVTAEDQRIYNSAIDGLRTIKSKTSVLYLIQVAGNDQLGYKQQRKPALHALRSLLPSHLEKFESSSYFFIRFIQDETIVKNDLETLLLIINDLGPLVLWRSPEDNTDPVNFLYPFMSEKKFGRHILELAIRTYGSVGVQSALTADVLNKFLESDYWIEAIYALQKHAREYPVTNGVPSMGSIYIAEFALKLGHSSDEDNKFNSAMNILRDAKASPAIFTLLELLQKCADSSWREWQVLDILKGIQPVGEPARSLLFPIVQKIANDSSKSLSNRLSAMHVMAKNFGKDCIEDLRKLVKIARYNWQSENTGIAESVLNILKELNAQADPIIEELPLLEKLVFNADKQIDGQALLDAIRAMNEVIQKLGQSKRRLY